VAVLDLTSTDAELKGFAGGFINGTYGYLMHHDNGDEQFGKVPRSQHTTTATTATTTPALDATGGFLGVAAAEAELKGFYSGFSDATCG
jgi:hypothetical protein